MLEMMIVTVMVFGDSDIVPAYEEIDRRNPNSGGSRTVIGERAYQIQLAQPSGDLPCRVQQAGRLS